MLLEQRLYLVKFAEGEEPVELFKVLVVDVYPELVEFVDARALRREVDRAALRLAELLPLRVEKQGEGDAVALAAGFFAREVHASDDVHLLVVAAHLQGAAVFVVEVVVVKGLKQYIRKLRVGDRFVGVEHAAAHIFAVDEETDRKVFSGIAQELDVVFIFEPIVVVDEQGAVISAFEIKEMLELLRDAGDIVEYLLLGEQVSLGALPRGVADAPRAAAGDGYRPVPQALEPRESHDGDEVPYVEAVGARVEADIARHHIFHEVLFKLFIMAAPLDETAFPQNLKCVRIHKKTSRV